MEAGTTVLIPNCPKRDATLLGAAERTFLIYIFFGGNLHDQVQFIH